MLTEIRSEVFKSYGEPRPPIKFKPGLNTVLGGGAGDNSIGKSTFLQIIDFAFGDNTYAKSKIIKQVSTH